MNALVNSLMSRLDSNSDSDPGSASVGDKEREQRNFNQHHYQDRVLALAGLVQAVSLINAASKSGLVSQDTLESSVNSIFVQNPDSAADVYGGVSGVRKGLSILRELLTHIDVAQHGRILQYVLAVMGLERKLVNMPAVMQQLGAEIANIDEQRILRHGDIRVLDDLMIQQLAALYESSISEIQPQIQINGNRVQLQDSANIRRIRALLLAAIRACVLWRQVGGNKWQLVFNRRAMSLSIDELL